MSDIIAKVDTDAMTAAANARAAMTHDQRAVIAWLARASRKRGYWRAMKVGQPNTAAWRAAAYELAELGLVRISIVAPGNRDHYRLSKAGWAVA